MSHRIALINPNISTAITRQMLGIALATAPTIDFVGLTADRGAEIILDEESLAEAVNVVGALNIPLDCDGVIVSAFGDPGLDILRNRLSVPVIGIAEAAMRAAASGERRFCVATTTPDLKAAIRRCAEAYGYGGQLGSVRITQGDAVGVMRDPVRLRQALYDAVETCAKEDGADVVVIGGGPLAAAAKSLAKLTSVPLIEPIPSAVSLMEKLILGRAIPTSRSAPYVLAKNR